MQRIFLGKSPKDFPGTLSMVFPVRYLASGEHGLLKPGLMHVKICHFNRGCSLKAAKFAAASPGQRAFTMVEVMVAVCVLAVASISLYGGLASGFIVVDSTRQELRATQILTQKAEALRLCTWASLTNCPISFSEPYDPTSANGGTLYVGTVSTNTPTVIPNSAAYRTNVCLATITLYWTNYSGTQKIVHSRTSQTLIARYGIQNYIWGAGQ